MKPLIRMTPAVRLAFSSHSRLFIIWGLLLTVLGLFAISYAATTTLLSIIILGSLLCAGGLVVILDSFMSWWKKWSAFFLHLITGILYFIIGSLLISGPEVGSLSITLLLGVFYVFIGCFRLVYSTFYELPGHRWRLINGLVSLLLGLLIIASWPSSAIYIIGLFIGIDLVFVGLGYTFIGFSAKRLKRSL